MTRNPLLTTLLTTAAITTLALAVEVDPVPADAENGTTLGESMEVVADDIVVTFTAEYDGGKPGKGLAIAANARGLGVDGNKGKAINNHETLVITFNQAVLVENIVLGNIGEDDIAVVTIVTADDEMVIKLGSAAETKLPDGVTVEQKKTTTLSFGTPVDMGNAPNAAIRLSNESPTNNNYFLDTLSITPAE